MRKLAAAFAAALAILYAGAAFAQSSPGVRQGQMPTAAQWNSYFAAKVDYAGYTPLNPANVISTTPIVTSQSAGIVTITCPTCLTTTGSFADPTNPGVNLTGSVGVATTAMRSDAVLALSQSIIPTWSGLHTFTGGLTVSFAVAAASNAVVRNTNAAGTAGWTAVNDSSVVAVGGMAGTTFSAAIYTGRGFFATSGAGSLGLVLGNESTGPTLFMRNLVEVGRWSGTVPGLLRAGVVGTLTGSLSIGGGGSGEVIQTVQSTAGSPTVTWGTGSGTPAVSATSPLAVASTTGNITCTTCATTTNGGALSATTPLALSAAGVISLNANGVTFAFMQQQVGLSLLGRSSSSSGDMATITGTANQIPIVNNAATSLVFTTVSGDVTNAAGVFTIGTAVVTYAKEANLGALAVKGRAANSSGVGADIQATAATDAVLRESGSTIGFGTIATAGIAANAVTNAKLATASDSTIKSNISGGTTTPSDNTITAVLDKQFGTTQGNVVYRNASAWVALAPGTNGQFLTSGGPAANLTWASGGAGTGTVTSITPDGGLVSSITAACSQTAISAAGTLSSASCINAQTGTSYAILDGDRAKLVTFSNAAAQAITIAQAGASSAFQTGWYTDVRNISTGMAGIVTITPSTSTINGAASFVLRPGFAVRIVSDGTNYQVTGMAPNLTLPTYQVFTSGSGTYTTPANVSWIRVKVIGGGGSASGSGNAGTGGNGNNGNNSTFGSSLLTAAGGALGTFTSNGGSGGAATVSAPAIGIGIAGGSGQGSGFGTSSGQLGGQGGSNCAGAGGGGPINNGGQAGVTNTGGGGGGAGTNIANYSGAGGGAGACIDAIIPSPSATYTYAVGAASTGGTAGTSGFAGGAGASGYIAVEEHYGP